MHKKLTRYKEEITSILGNFPDKSIVSLPSGNEKYIGYLPTPYMLKETIDLLVICAQLNRNSLGAVILYDDGMLKCHDTHTINDEDDINKKILIIHEWIQKNFPDLFVPISKFFDEDALIKIEKKVQFFSSKLDSVDKIISLPYGNFIVSSARRYFTDVELENIKEEKWKNWVRLCLHDCFMQESLSKSVLRVFPELKTLMGVHPIYVSYGPFVSILRSKNIAFIEISPSYFSYNSNKLIFNGNSAIRDYGICANRPMLTNVQRHHLSKVLDQRMKANNNYEEESLKRKIKNKKAKDFIVVGIFPNVLPDAALVEYDHLFKNVLSWLLQTLDVLIGKKNILIVIRIHPHEHKNWKLTRDTASYLEKYSQCRDIILIDSHNNISSYSFLPLLDLAIVYTGTLALEASYIGVPVLMGGVNAYSNILNPDVSSDLNYWERLDSLCTCQNKISCRTIEDKVLSMLYNEYIDHEFLTEWTDDTNTYSRISGDWRASLLETSDYVKKIIMSTS